MAAFYRDVSTVQFRTTWSGGFSGAGSSATVRNRFPSGDTSKPANTVPSFNEKSGEGCPSESEWTVRTGTEIS